MTTKMTNGKTGRKVNSNVRGAKFDGCGLSFGDRANFRECPVGLAFKDEHGERFAFCMDFADAKRVAGALVEMIQLRERQAGIKPAAAVIPMRELDMAPAPTAKPDRATLLMQAQAIVNVDAKTIKDQGTCVLGAGIKLPGVRRPVVSAPFQGNVAQYQACKRALAFLLANGVDAAYDDGVMD